MQSEFLFATFRSFLEDKASVCTWILFGATVLYFLRDCFELLRKVEKDEMKRGSAIRKGTLDICLMVVAFAAALGSQWASKTSDDKIEHLETNSIAYSNKFVVAEKRLKEVEERPGRAKISDIKATVEIKASGVIEDRKFGDISNDPLGVLLNLKLGRSSSSIQKSSWAVFSLIANKFNKGQGQSDATYFIEFLMSPINPLHNGAEMTVDQLSELDMIILTMGYIPPNTEIIEGSATVTFNSSIIRKYPIPAQKTQTPFSIMIGNFDRKSK